MNDSRYLGMVGDFAGADSCDRPPLIAWRMAGVVLLMGCVLVRFWDALTQIGLYVEDALLFNSYYATALPLKAIFKSHIGQPYLTVPADFFAWLYAWIDVRWQPWLYQWTGLAFTLCAASLLSFSGLIKSRYLLVVGPVILGMLGVNDLYYYNTLIYVMYTGVLILLLLLFFSPPCRIVSYLFQAILLGCLPWSGPYSVLLLPVAFFLFFAEPGKDKKMLYVIGFVSTLLYFSTVKSGNLRLGNIAETQLLSLYFSEILKKVLLFNFFQEVDYRFWIVIILFVSGCCFIFRHDFRYICFSLSALGIIFISIAMFYLSSKSELYSELLSSHQVIASFFWVAFLLVTADRIVSQCHPVFSLAVACAFLALVFLDGVWHPSKWILKPIANVQRFVDTIAYYELRGFERKRMSVCLYLPLQPGSRMTPLVVVGDRTPGATHLNRTHPEITQGNNFVCPVFPMIERMR